MGLVFDGICWQTLVSYFKILDTVFFYYLHSNNFPHLGIEIDNNLFVHTHKN
jgi:hypothetical protein